MFEWICLVIIVVFFIFYIIGYASDWDGLIWVGGCVFVVMLIFSAIVIPVVYIESYDLPNGYIGKCEAIEETEEMLLKYTNTTDIAFGLEAVQLKSTLAEIISEKNEKLAGMRAWLSNPIMPFKDNIRENLGVYIADI